MNSPVLEKKKVTDKKLQPPKKYKVLLCNDDVTPMEFVVSLLISIFKHNEQQAVDTMLQVHKEGSAVAGVYTFEIAEQKGIDSTNLARAHGYPLVIKIEEA